MHNIRFLGFPLLIQVPNNPFFVQRLQQTTPNNLLHICLVFYYTIFHWLPSCMWCYSRCMLTLSIFCWDTLTRGSRNASVTSTVGLMSESVAFTWGKGIKSTLCEERVKLINPDFLFKTVVCSANEFRCQNGICISKDRRCNGRYDCSDASDEIGCRKSEDPQTDSIQK